MSVRWVYVIGSESGPHKVGVAGFVKGRLAQLQTSHHEVLTVRFSVPHRDAMAIEKRAHEILADRRACGEWFRCEASEAIAAVCQAMVDYEERERAPKESKAASVPVVVTREIERPVIQDGRLLRLLQAAQWSVAVVYDTEGWLVMHPNLEMEIINTLEGFGMDLFNSRQSYLASAADDLAKGEHFQDLSGWRRDGLEWVNHVNRMAMSED